MAHTSADTKEHGGHDDHFLSQLKHLKQAEGEAAAKTEEAKKQSAAIEAQAREKAVGIISFSKDKSVEAKNQALSKARAETDSEINSMLSDAKRQSEKVKAKKLNEKQIESLSSSIL